MDFSSLYYFQELCKDLNMHRTSERIYVSQQTISNNILRLEEELDCKLFERRRPFLSLTCAGEIVLRYVNESIMQQKNLKDILKDISNEERGVIYFGASMLRLSACLPVILPVFHRRYPKVSLMLKDRVERELETLVLAGEVDLGVIVQVTNEEGLIVEPLLNDQVYVCVPDQLLRDVYGDEKAAEIRKRCAEGTDLKDLSLLPFCRLDNRLGREIDLCFEEAEVKPNIFMTSSYMQIAASVGFKGVSAFFATQVGISSHEDVPSDLNIFPLLRKGEPLYHKIYLIENKKRYLPSYTKYFKELLVQHYEAVSREHAQRIAGEK